MGDKRFPGESALEALFGAIKSALSSKQNQTLSTTIAGSSTVEGALQALEQSYSGLDYDELDNKPQINGVELSGNKTASDLGIAIPTNLSDLNDDSTHRLVTDTEKSAWNGKADTTDITNAISALDVASVGGTGKYISEISEADGKISARERGFDNIPIAGSPDPVKSGGVFNAIEDSVSLKTATGNPITLTDAANADAEELLMTIEPIQDLHGYSKPWPGGGGKNLLPMTVDGIKAANTSGTWDGNVYTLNGVTFSIQTDNDGNVTGIVADGTATGAHALFIIGGIPLKTSITYKYNGNPSGLDNNKRIDIYNSDNSYFTSIVSVNDFILEPINNDTYYVRISVLNGYTVSNLLFKPMLRLSSETDATFAPYANICPISGLTSGEVETTDGTDTNTANITFGQTVYGGSVNFKTGEVTVTHGMVDLGTLNWLYNTNGGFSSDTLTDIKTGLCELVCSGLSFYPESFIWGDIANIPNYSIAKNAGNKDLYVKDTDYTNAAAFKTAMSGVQLCYELATPTTLTLTPAELELLKGNNTITANGAEISIEYYPDNAIGALAGRVDDASEQIATKANTTDVNTALAGKADVTTVTIPRFTPSQAGWRRICKIKPTSGNTVEGIIYVGGNWSNGQPPSATIGVNTLNNYASLTLLSGTGLVGNLLESMRLINVNGTEYWLDVYFPAFSSSTGPYRLTFTGDIAVSDIQNPISITTDATAATDEISLNQNVSGTVLTDKSGLITGDSWETIDITDTSRVSFTGFTGTVNNFRMVGVYTGSEIRISLFIYIRDASFTDGHTPSVIISYPEYTNKCRIYQLYGGAFGNDSDLNALYQNRGENMWLDATKNAQQLQLTKQNFFKNAVSGVVVINIPYVIIPVTKN